jgi:hypothetical protein
MSLVPTGNSQVDNIIEHLLAPGPRSDSDTDWLQRAYQYGDVPQARPSRDEIRRREAVRMEWRRALTGESWNNDGTCYDLATWAGRPGDYTSAELDALVGGIAAMLASIR